MMHLPISFLSRPLAHRGLHDVADGRPENSRAAIIAAIDKGYGIEIDLQLSKDKKPVVFHDAALGRLTNQKGPVSSRSFSDLQAISLKGSTETIPGFQEVLDLVAGRVPLLVEFKDQDGHLGSNVGALERPAAQMIQNYSGEIAVMSFNPSSVAALKDLLPDVPRGLTTCRYKKHEWLHLEKVVRKALRQIPDFDTVGACFISHDHCDLDRKYVRAVKTKGFPVLTWTIKSFAEEIEARKIADNITFEQYLA